MSGANELLMARARRNHLPGAPAAPAVLTSRWCTPVGADIYESGPFASGAFDAVAGSLIIVGIYQSRYNDRPITSVLDTAGNNFVKCPAPFVSISGSSVLVPWYCLASKAKAGNVVSCNNAASLNNKGFRVAQVSTPTGKSWSFDTSSGQDSTASYISSISTPAINTTGAGLVYILGEGNQSQLASAWTLSPCSNPLGGLGGTNTTSEEPGVDGIDFTSGPVSGRVSMASFPGNTHPILAQFAFKLS